MILEKHIVNPSDLKWASDAYSDALLQSAITILKEDPMKNERKKIKLTIRTIEHEGPMNAVDEGIDNTPLIAIESGSTNPQPTHPQPTQKEDTMSFDAPEDHSGYTETINPVATPEPTKQDLAAAKAKAKIAEKEAKAAAKLKADEVKAVALAAKKEAAELAKAEKAAARLEAIQSKNTRTKEEREAAKAARAERLAALDPDGTKKYHGSMLALADRVKQGAYVKGATGQLRSTNELAEVLDAVPVDNVIQLAKIVLELPENPYVNLNSGQQSMNLRNRMRGAIAKGTLTLDAIRNCIEENGFATATDWAALAEAKRAARAEKAAIVKAEKEAKAAAKAEVQE